MKKDNAIIPINVKGAIEKGYQFDLDITLPNDYRSAIYGVVRDQYQNPVYNAVVKLFEVTNESNERALIPVSHTFTDENGEFVFGPLCDDTLYEIQIWVNRITSCKTCITCTHEGDCLHGIEEECPPSENTSCKKDEK